MTSQPTTTIVVNVHDNDDFHVSLKSRLTDEQGKPKECPPYYELDIANVTFFLSPGHLSMLAGQLREHASYSQLPDVPVTAL